MPALPLTKDNLVTLQVALQQYRYNVENQEDFCTKMPITSKNLLLEIDYLIHKIDAISREDYFDDEKTLIVSMIP